jgi:hypothetical protein
MPKTNYEKDAVILCVSFGQNEHVTGVELGDNILLQLDTGKATGELPRAIGLTLVSFSHVMAHHRAGR